MAAKTIRSAKGPVCMTSHASSFKRPGGAWQTISTVGYMGDSPKKKTGTQTYADDTDLKGTDGFYSLVRQRQIPGEWTKKGIPPGGMPCQQSG